MAVEVESIHANATLVPAATLRAFATAIFAKAGVPADQAADAAEVLIWANLHGVDTHGLRNLKRAYIERMAEGRIKPQPQFRIEYETPITARVDGDSGLGLVAGCWAMRLAIAKANETGIGIVAVRNSHHFGAAGFHAMQAIPHNMIGVSLTGFFTPKGAEIGVLPTFAKRPMLSTNPISVAVPTGVELPFLLDMATSITPMNRVWLYREAGKPIPLGWAQDGNGEPTVDPDAARFLLPLGGTREMGGHKGYGLSMMVEIFCALLSGGWDQTGADGSYAQTGDAHFFMALRVDAFRPVDAFKQGMDAMIDALHQAEPVEGQERVLVAGEPEQTNARKRGEHGIPIAPNVMEDLRELSAQFGVPLAV